MCRENLIIKENSSPSSHGLKPRGSSRSFLNKDKKSFSIYLNDSLADKNITFSFNLEISEKIEKINGKKNNVMTFNYTVSYKSR